MNDMTSLAVQQTRVKDPEQFRLRRIQLFNWGTFDGLTEIPVSAPGHLIIGKSGAGKSTILDAHATILTPPKWLTYNDAANDSAKRKLDRSLVSYIRGHWAQLTSDDGVISSQYLRRGPTWSAIAETYQSGLGKIVTLCQIFWIKGSSTAREDIHRLYLVVDDKFDLKQLETFPRSNFDVRILKDSFKHVMFRTEFSAYEDIFSRRMGVESERALRLLLKTQSVKNLPDLNVFLREFMLDEPSTSDAANSLVTEFQELNDAHKAVVVAREQIEILAPAAEQHAELTAERRQKERFTDLMKVLDRYREQKRLSLYREEIEKCEANLAVANGKFTQCGVAEEFAREAFDQLERMRLEQGGGEIARLEKALADAEKARTTCVNNRNRLIGSCRVLGIELPSNAEEFERKAIEYRANVIAGPEKFDPITREGGRLDQELLRVDRELNDVARELSAMMRQRSNIPAHMLELRADLAREVGVPERELPFAGELLEVNSADARWQGAIERVLHNFALSLLVSDRHYGAVAGYLNRTYIGARLVYLRTIPHSQERRPTSTASLVRKVKVADHPNREWLTTELSLQFNYECTETERDFTQARQAVSLQGQIKFTQTRHEKDDRYKIDDRSRWVLGFDNKARLELFHQKKDELEEEKEAITKAITRNKTSLRQHTDLLGAWQVLSNERWDAIDLATAGARVESSREILVRETQAHPGLKALEEQLSQKKETLARAQTATSTARAEQAGITAELEKYKKQIAQLTQSHFSSPISAEFVEYLDQAYAKEASAIGLENVFQVASSVERRLNKEQATLVDLIKDREGAVKTAFSTFNRNWPAEAAGLDPTLPSAPDYFAKLERLQLDGLPRHEEKFMELLHAQSDENLALLSNSLTRERSVIGDRLAIVNQGLRNAAYNPGTYLAVDLSDRNLPEVLAFKQQLREALAGTFDADLATAEKRFGFLSSIVARLSSQEYADRQWRALVLDVRQHVDFLARERNQDGREVDVFEGGSGKSGGQRQKLATTCLAAALRYQLGGADRNWPLFSTVVLDEAFNNSDHEFTTMCMEIFETFGFQMIVATPNAKVMVLEPFVGGACLIHIEERRFSKIKLIEYDEDRGRLDLKGLPEDDDE